jgi:hypothetical protein
MKITEGLISFFQSTHNFSEVVIFALRMALFSIKSSVILITGCFFLHFKEHTLGGEGVKMGQNENYTAFFCID